MKIKIILGDKEILAELYNNKTAKEIYKILPIKSSFNTWGDEIYFRIPLHLELDNSTKEVVQIGELGFWPEGDCFCIFYGKTPASRGNEIRPASAVNVFGKIVKGIEKLKTLKASRIIIEKYLY